GTVSVAFGAEYREEQYQDLYDALQQAGNITGSAGNSAGGDRDIFAAYGEILVPIFDNLEFTAAARYDDYSDFGDEISPKVALRFEPIDNLVFRASWGEGFRAPPLPNLTSLPSFSADTVRDPQTCVFFGLDPDCQTQVTGFVLGNPNLGAEQSEQFSIGTSFQPFDWFNGTIDYWNIEVTDRVANLGAAQLVACDLGTTTNCPPGLSNLPANANPPVPALGLGVARNAEGAIVYLQRGSASLGTIQQEGFDINLRSNFDFGSAGRLTVDALGTYLMTYEIDDGANIAGANSLPRWRATLATNYAIWDFAFAWIMNYTGGNDALDASDPDGRLPSWIIHDVQANWFTPWNGQFTIGVDNVADRDPVLDAGEGRSFNFDLYDGYGRVPYIRYTQSF
ncbi:MAG: TonB-dependent receptor, partial [Pseudomonadota bacterium]